MICLFFSWFLFNFKEEKFNFTSFICIHFILISKDEICSRFKKNIQTMIASGAREDFSQQIQWIFYAADVTLFLLLYVDNLRQFKLIKKRTV